MHDKHLTLIPRPFLSLCGKQKIMTHWQNILHQINYIVNICALPSVSSAAPLSLRPQTQQCWPSSSWCSWPWIRTKKQMKESSTSEDVSTGSNWSLLHKKSQKSLFWSIVFNLKLYGYSYITRNLTWTQKIYLLGLLWRNVLPHEQTQSLHFSSAVRVTWAHVLLHLACWQN